MFSTAPPWRTPQTVRMRAAQQRMLTGVLLHPQTEQSKQANESEQLCSQKQQPAQRWRFNRRPPRGIWKLCFIPCRSRFSSNNIGTGKLSIYRDARTNSPDSLIAQHLIAPSTTAST